ncbi:Sfi1 spindle body protein-domain-containing protein [Clohesyomyces aquaticus]|uniref:Sfi1 spindle body protein-domain-containing protein n=1 Tax=Clohesyomyces aquaticus TaxID=1231657 RepID=A0A1Y1ZKM7_9PLEO|nr:Sfi1 spindle body protein-domain-containing protein [Clohesyomyces aquaticus]
MPPSMNAVDHENETPALTNEDIEILYDIVRLAQSLPERTFRALFQAYDKVLSERKINPDNDTRYLRFLFRMQDPGEKEDEGLVERFQRLLGEMGIQVECDPEGDGIEEITRNVDNLVPNGQLPPTPNTLGPGGRSRRGSFESFFDATADKVRETDVAQDRPAISRRAYHGAASDTEDTRGQGRPRSGSDPRPLVLAQLPIRGRVNGGGSGRVMSDNITSRPRRTGSVSSRGSLHIYRDGHTGTRPVGGYDGDESEQTDSFERSHVQIPGVNAPIPGMGHQPPSQYAAPALPFRPSDTQMMDDADTFEYHRLLSVVRNCIRTWREKTRIMHEAPEQMNVIASAFDRRVLLRASLDSWRVALQNRRQALETERFFNRLETRAEKARNLFLLTKAFTHWAKSAEDEVLRTSVARRHILRTKYFNAWRDITAVNELKIQHHVLGKFLNIWRKRTAIVQEKEDAAIVLYEENIVRKNFWKWFFAFCNRAAPVWNRERLARNVLLKWVEIVRVLKERENWAADRRDRELLRRVMLGMRQKAMDVREMKSQAEEFRRTALLASGFRAVATQATLNPLFAQVAQRVDERILRSTLRAWQHNGLLARVARNVDRERILRNTFTAWNDRLRISEMARRIDVRVQVEALYKWVLASQGLLLYRRHDRTLKTSTFSTWVDKARDRRARLEDAEGRFAAFKRAQMLRTCLRKLEDKTVERKGQEYLALSAYQPRLKQRTFGILLQKHDHYQQLETWANDAQFYVLATNTLKRWTDATQHARRNRRRESYAHVRRIVKLNLVKRSFGIWKEKAGRFAVAERQAQELVENRVLRTSVGLLTNWHSKTATIVHLSAQASAKFNAKITGACLSNWIEKYRLQQTRETQAEAMRQENIDLAASGALKKLEWRLWNVKRRENDAVALRQRNFEKHVRAMLRFWAEQMSERRAWRERGESESPSPSRGPRGGGGGGGGGPHDDDDGQGGDDGYHGEFLEEQEVGDETQRVENWTAFDENALGLSTTNLDLSLSFSPKGRAARVRSQPQPQSQTRPRPQPQPQLQQRPPPSIRKPYTQPPPIEEVEQEEEDLEHDLSDFDEANSNFWTSTPMPHPILKPGYLKTPSKRSVARAKRPELPASPERRPVPLAAASAPVPGLVNRLAGGKDVVTSFEMRLREGGFGGGMGGDGVRGKRAGMDTGTRTGTGATVGVGRGGMRGLGGGARGRTVGFRGFGDEE